MILNKLDKSDLQSIVRSRGFEAMKRVADDLIRRWTNELPTGDQQFEYLKSSLMRDGKLAGLSQFLHELEKHALNERQ